MPDHSRVFTYEVEGLVYTVTVYEEDGAFYADITVLEGAMDVNAIYFGDDDFSGDSEMLEGPLNMNGARLDGEKIQWDAAARLSDPGLGPEGTEKETYLSEGDTLTVELTGIDSLDEIDVFGIRATSTTTDGGSIKGVSDDPEEPEDPEEPLIDKVGFGVEVGENGIVSNGVNVFADDLPEGEDATFENLLNLYLSAWGDHPDYNLSEVETVVFYELVPGTDENGDPIEIPQELFRIDAPEGGFASADELLAAYDDAIESGALEGATPDEDGGLELMAALSLGEDFGAEAPEEDFADEDDLELI